MTNKTNVCIDSVSLESHWGLHVGKSLFYQISSLANGTNIDTLLHSEHYSIPPLS
jgi:hypothetical protein